MSTQELLLSILKYEIRALQPSAAAMAELASEEKQARVLAVAKKHEIAALVAHALQALGVPLGGAVLLEVQKQIVVAKHHYECMNYEITEMSRVLSEKKIEHVFLKGAELRAHYPIPWIRTSCDVDLLVREECLDMAVSALESELSYQRKSRSPHDVTMDAPSKVHVELHFGLIESDVVEGMERVLLDVWDHLSAESGQYRMKMSDEMFYYYHVAHMAKHFVHGGCGIRPFLDFWILENTIEYNAQMRDELLARGELQIFRGTVRELSAVWLEGKDHTERSEKVERFIMYGGVYGNTANKVIVQQSKKGGKRSYAISRIFPPYQRMCYSYPILKRRKWLLPFMYVRRFFRIIRRGRLATSLAELKYNENITKDEQNENRRFLEDVGLCGSGWSEK